MQKPSGVVVLICVICLSFFLFPGREDRFEGDHNRLGGRWGEGHQMYDWERPEMRIPEGWARR